MYFRSFTDIQLILLIAALGSFLSSLFFHVKGKGPAAAVFLAITSLLIFSFAALLDPFLNLWDERFHALVGKNLMHHPLMPTLYDDPVVGMAYDRWDRYHIWIHKQPLFLWQIALSFKIFGVSEFALRIPDIILGAALVFAGYRSGRALVNERTGYVTGILIMTSLYLMELVAGRQELDHNDFSFLAYISLSIWSLIEYRRTNRRYWIFLTGAFSGFAILCKWVVGLLVYLGWFAINIQLRKVRPKDYLDLATALLVTILIALPWQVLTFSWYPAEAAQTYGLNLRHFTFPLDGHHGSFLYHFEKINLIYGGFAAILILPSFFFLYRNSKDKPMAAAMFVMTLAIYLFFSLAATKMPSFTIVAAMMVFIALAALLDQALIFISGFIKGKQTGNLIFAVSVIFLVLLRFDMSALHEKHSPENQYSKMLIHNRSVFRSLDLPPNAVLFNVRGRHYIEAMFYTGLPAYNFIPTAGQCDELKSRGRKIAVFIPEGTVIPASLEGDTSVTLLNMEIEGYD